MVAPPTCECVTPSSDTSPLVDLASKLSPCATVRTLRASTLPLMAASRTGPLESASEMSPLRQETSTDFDARRTSTSPLKDCM